MFVHTNSFLSNFFYSLKSGEKKKMNVLNIIGKKRNIPPKEHMENILCLEMTWLLVFLEEMQKKVNAISPLVATAMFSSNGFDITSSVYNRQYPLSIDCFPSYLFVPREFNSLVFKYKRLYSGHSNIDKRYYCMI